MAEPLPPPQALIAPNKALLKLTLMGEAVADGKLAAGPHRGVPGTKSHTAWPAVSNFAAASPAARLSLGADTDEVAEAISGALARTNRLAVHDSGTDVHTPFNTHVHIHNL